MHDKNGDPLLLVLPDLPSELREPLIRQLQLTFGHCLAVRVHITTDILPGYIRLQASM